MTCFLKLKIVQRHKYYRLSKIYFTLNKENSVTWGVWLVKGSRFVEIQTLVARPEVGPANYSVDQPGASMLRAYRGIGSLAERASIRLFGALASREFGHW